MNRCLSRAAAALRPASSGWVAGVLVLTWIAVGLHLREERPHALAAARANGANLARAFSESLLRTVREVDQTLLFVRALRERDGPSVDLSPWIDRVDRLQVLAAQIAMTDRAGRVTMSNLRPVTERIDLSDRAHFRRFADHPEDVLHIGAPVLGRVSNLWTVQFVRMLRDPQGGFDGILVVSVPPAALLRFAAPVDLGPRGTVSVLGLDGVLRARMAQGEAGGGVGRTPRPARRCAGRRRRTRAASPGPTRWTGWPGWKASGACRDCRWWSRSAWRRTPCWRTTPTTCRACPRPSWR